MTVCDIIITSGGSSVGEKVRKLFYQDFINQALKKLQFDIKFGRIYIKPGKPTIFATASHDNKCIYFFGLPGNPVSCWVTYHLLVKTFLYKVLNISPPPIIKVKLSSDLETDEKRMEFLRARFLPRYDNGYRVVEVIPGGQHSSRFLSVCGCDLLVIIPSSYQKRCFPKGTLMEGIIISSI
ncbi:Molybdenum cofactor synthesis protein cinnamon [Thelohanellus kitauei]|uniref:Molybdenum cofactor synthesis protein cinnamon n=1 Tax=Thelohanellus kitauei TaxID=669202 RepID=A0A0C2NE46_THEKT|nr:Molybdenum cofactor synthesis protein cinnamon [Thelohanellus kitauei]